MGPRGSRGGAGEAGIGAAGRRAPGALTIVGAGASRGSGPAEP